MQESRAGYHLQVELVVFIEFSKVTLGQSIVDPLIGQPYAVIKVAKPYNSIVVFDRPVSLETQTMTDSLVISISLLKVCESSS